MELKGSEHLLYSPRGNENEIYKLILENLSDFAWIYNTVTERYTYFSPSVFQLSGFTVEECLCKSIEDLHPIHASEIRKKINEALKRFKQNDFKGSEYHSHSQFARKDGSLFWVDANTRFLLNSNNEIEIIGISRNIDDLINSQIAVTVSEEKLRSIFSAAHIGLVLCDTNGRYIDFNPWWCDYLGYTKEEMNSISFQDITHPKDREITLSNFSRLVNGTIDQYRVVKRFYRKDGTTVWCDLSASPTKDSSGKITSVIGVISDVTEVIKKSNELKELNATKDKFFSIVAHDMRSPFNAIIGSSDMLSESIDTLNTEEIKSIAGMLNSSAKNLFALLNHLLEWAKLQQGLVKFNPVKFDAVEKINNIVELNSHSCLRKNIKMTVNVPESIFVLADNYMFTSIFGNIISNAIKFTPNGGWISILAKVKNGLMKVSVTDTGIGMDEYTENNLFNIAVNTNRFGTDGEASTGLGLIISKEFIEMHGGEIFVRSEENVGTTISFTLPLYLDPQ